MNTIIKLLIIFVLINCFYLTMNLIEKQFNTKIESVRKKCYDLGYECAKFGRDEVSEDINFEYKVDFFKGYNQGKKEINHE